ncbi:hypothetical protein SAMN05421821_10246 [Mucilaginibacter lappiensis]|uniref:Uncharacterized protein n=1 Tax=Mucilaginibacter lappiensis TaxID=354630 RepID=A0ABR6PHJ6_9SPHI|nr:hypothetical protein [Mucilaginibacter lappiensis]MBB6108719.1 hypothetical protein [Mucilaginibacter lappiensis]SIQ26644.1 hypothetical protein SAMN05421821_10246 [Mucilaginibacter lappiensis]
MKNFKQVAFGLILGAMVFSFSAFTNSASSKVNKSKFTKTFYGLNQAGTIYTREASNPAGDCTPKSNNPSCVISYPSDQGPSLNVSSLPSGSTSESSPGWVNP